MSAPREKIRVAVTGANSFTGLWIARSLHARGYAVQALIGSPRSRYTGLKAERTDALAAVARIWEEVRAESGGMADWIRANPVDIWIHHHHFMENYRLPEYDQRAAMLQCIEPLPAITQALRESGCRGAVYSSSFFEPGERGRPPSDPPSPYGISKAETWRALAGESRMRGLPVSRVVIPNPVGPFENDDRIIPALVRHAREKKEFVIRDPLAISDYLPAAPLGEIYAQACDALLHGKPETYRPSGKTATAREWVSEVRSELLEKRLGIAGLQVSERPSRASASPPIPSGAESVTAANVDWKEFWDAYGKWLGQRL